MLFNEFIERLLAKGDEVNEESVTIALRQDDGKGVSTETDQMKRGLLYDGGWQKGFGPHGVGAFRGSGWMYRGDWKSGYPHGRGSVYLPSGAFYHGDVKQGLPHGRGRFVDSRGKTEYSGEWKRGQRHGLGTQTFESGMWYVGRFHEGQAEGVGTLMLNVQERFQGRFHKGMADGAGVLRLGNGDALIGEWAIGCAAMNRRVKGHVAPHAPELKLPSRSPLGRTPLPSTKVKISDIIDVRVEGDGSDALHCLSPQHLDTVAEDLLWEVYEKRIKDVSKEDKQLLKTVAMIPGALFTLEGLFSVQKEVDSSVVEDALKRLEQAELLVKFQTQVDEDVRGKDLFQESKAKAPILWAIEPCVVHCTFSPGDREEHRRMGKSMGEYWMAYLATLEEMVRHGDQYCAFSTCISVCHMIEEIWAWLVQEKEWNLVFGIAAAGPSLLLRIMLPNVVEEMALLAIPFASGFPQKLAIEYMMMEASRLGGKVSAAIERGATLRKLGKQIQDPKDFYLLAMIAETQGLSCNAMALYLKASDALTAAWEWAKQSKEERLIERLFVRQSVAKHRLAAFRKQQSSLALSSSSSQGRPLRKHADPLIDILKQSRERAEQSGDRWTELTCRLSMISFLVQRKRWEVAEECARTASVIASRVFSYSSEASACSAVASVVTAAHQGEPIPQKSPSSSPSKSPHIHWVASPDRTPRRGDPPKLTPTTNEYVIGGGLTVHQVAASEWHERGLCVAASAGLFGQLWRLHSIIADGCQSEMTAVIHFQAALRAARKPGVMAPGSMGQNQEGVLLLALGRSLVDNGMIRRAVSMLEMAQSLFEQAHSPALQTQSMILLGKAHSILAGQAARSFGEEGDERTSEELSALIHKAHEAHEMAFRTALEGDGGRPAALCAEAAVGMARQYRAAKRNDHASEMAGFAARLLARSCDGSLDSISKWAQASSLQAMSTLRINESNHAVVQRGATFLEFARVLHEAVGDSARVAACRERQRVLVEKYGESVMVGHLALTTPLGERILAVWERIAALTAAKEGRRPAPAPPSADTARKILRAGRRPWVPDCASHHCMRCETKFMLLNRRHHCRWCGVLCCGECASTWLPLKTHSRTEDANALVRVCGFCAESGGTSSSGAL